MSVIVKLTSNIVIFIAFKPYLMPITLVYEETCHNPTYRNCAEAPEYSTNNAPCQTLPIQKPS